jgi:hypothetical protein
MRKLWNDDCGIIIQAELVFVLTILVIGTVTALVALRQAVISEMTEVAEALMALNQSYSFAGQTNCLASTAGSAASDAQNDISEANVAAGTAATVAQAPCD